MSRIYSHKKESRMRTPEGLKCLPNDLHAALNEEKTAGDYETLWATAVHAMRLGAMVMEGRRKMLAKNINSMVVDGNNR